MKHIHFDVESDGFYGAYWACKDGSDCAVIAMLGDDPEDHMARSAVKWLLRLGVNILTLSPGKKDYRVEKRLAEKPHSSEVEAVVYKHCTHFAFPDGMLRTMLPVGSALFVKPAFSAAKKYPKECKTARIDIDCRMTRVICDWRDKMWTN